MEEMKDSPPLNTSTTIATAAANREQETSAMSRIKKDCLAFGGFRHVKAILVGQVETKKPYWIIEPPFSSNLNETNPLKSTCFWRQTKRLKARNEKKATAAELRAQTMQVEAANEAENTKETIYKSM